MSENNFIQFKGYIDGSSPSHHESLDVWVRKDTIDLVSVYPSLPHNHTILYLNNGKEMIVEGHAQEIFDYIESVE